MLCWCDYTINQYSTGQNIFFEDDQWKQAYDAAGELWMDANGIETKYLKDELLWTTLYRLSM